ncbi:hypothetical protein NMK91_00535 [Corynebacterium pseudotuberculosis]|uniref:hypothetical protein n=1 Tax=Corynebacterium pseudotuberculosis TaxID=1719 RepID=UPI0004D73117|nr:hypothetical protein [Corynebacterium pseudotuberculosis]AKS12455.1 Hypothetical protein CpE19_0112 [Corynebacterium pseudotuberculosis]KEX89172.1 hypothetical protein CPTD_00910 [Corynebacterium pseudotuberculosis]UTO24586.1 hypothetical protein NMK91_00535 [Corynebacterium pseudotuberculosis]VTQ72972.1 putative secreted protein [Corynebacterium pseudotuberculosis]
MFDEEGSLNSMSYFQFRPAMSAKSWWLVAVVVTLLLVLPAALNAVVPSIDFKLKNVILGKKDSFELLVVLDDGAHLQCKEEMSDLFQPQWDCEGTRINSMVVDGSTDQDHTLRRMMRLNAKVPLPKDAKIFREGNIRIIEGASQVGLSLAVQGEDEQKTLFVLVTGPDTDNAVQLIAKNFQNYAVKGATA